MKVVIVFHGNRYESQETTDHTADEVSELFYKDFSSMDKFKMELAGGGSLILGKDAVQNAVVMFLP